MTNEERLTASIEQIKTFNNSQFIKDTDGTPLDLINMLTHVSSTGAASASNALDSVSRSGAEKLVLDRVDTFIGILIYN